MLDKSFSQIDNFRKMMNVEWLRNKAITNNIANVDTPGYKREIVEFSQVLEEVHENNRLKKTHEDHIGRTDDGPRLKKINNTSFRKDKNNVDIDTEMANLAKNQLKFNMMTNQLSLKIRRMKDAIKSGR